MFHCAQTAKGFQNITKATASIDLTKKFDLALPGSEKFESTDFTVGRSANVKKAETNEHRNAGDNREARDKKHRP